MATAEPRGEFTADPSVIESLRRTILDADLDVTWSEPGDLSRMSFEALVAERTHGRVLASRGSLHLTGDGVDGHQASLASVSNVMASFQRFIDATGAAIEGITTARGRLAESIISRTRLNLEASPQPGSVRLLLTPATPVSDEIPDDVALFDADGDDDQLADRAIRVALDLIDDGVNSGPVADEFADTVRSRGPRVASALLSFAESLSDGSFNIDLGWEQPGRPTRRIHANTSDARRILMLIHGRNLDEVETDVHGEVIRVSTERTALVLLDAEGETVRIERGELADDDLDTITVRSNVTVRVNETARILPNGTQQHTYKALSIQLNEA